MNKQSELKARVLQLARGNRNPGNLDAIFLWLRARSFKMRTVKDIGDFIAHPDQRDQGAVHSHVSDVITGCLFALKGEQFPNIKVVAFLESTMRLEDAAVVRRELGIGQKKANSILRSLIPLMIDIEGEFIDMRRDLSDEESKVLEYYLNRHYISAAFTAQQFMDELVCALTKNGLLQAVDEKALRSQSGFICTYVATKMHLCEMRVEGIDVTLQARPSPNIEHNQIAVVANCLFHNGKGFVTIRYSVFETSCLIDEWCESGSKDDAYWSRPLEIGPSGVIVAWDLQAV